MLQALESYFYSCRYYDYISPYGTLLRNPQPPWRLLLLLSVVLPRSRALPIPFTGIPDIDALIDIEEGDLELSSFSLCRCFYVAFRGDLLESGRRYVIFGTEIAPSQR
jgi:hypothetical protein